MSYGFAVRPVWVEVLLSVAIAVAVLGATWIVNSYYLPPVVARRLVEARGLAWPADGVSIAHGYAIPVLIALGTGILVTFLASRTRFGRPEERRVGKELV